MRDVNRIDNILEELGRLWKDRPDYRLGQLILGVGSERRVWNMEDNVLLEELRAIHERNV